MTLIPSFLALVAYVNEEKHILQLIHNSYSEYDIFYVFGVKHLVSWNLQFFAIQDYSPVTECDFCSVLIFLVSSFTRASNARFDGMV